MEECKGFICCVAMDAESWNIIRIPTTMAESI